MYKLLLIIYCFIFTVEVSAQTPEEIAKRTQIANINTILIFTSQDSLTSGIYRFTNADVEMEVYHLPFIYHFKSNQKYNYFIVGNAGYSKIYLSADVTPPAGTTLTYENYIGTYTIGLGGGVRYKISDDIGILGGMEIIYSRSGNSAKTSNTNIDEPVTNFFNGNKTDNITYKFFTLAEYRPVFYKFKPYVSLAYKLYQTKSSFSVDVLRSFSTQSNVTTFTIGSETPKLLKYHDNYLTLEGYFNTNYLGGDVAKVTGFESYETLGAVSYLYTPNYEYVKRFFLEVSTARSSGLEGYNIGIGFTARF